MSRTTQPRKSKTRRLDVPVASQRRRQIIEAARACISEEGVERLTLRKVGERAQVSHATIAYYFRTRRELIDSALQEISVDFMDALRQRHPLYGMSDLVDLVDRFLNADYESGRFIVQMIDAGQHDAELRPIHDEFIRYGRDRIERSIRVAMEAGDLRADLDPVLGAALLHTILIWWQSELVAGATTREPALEVGRALLRLLASPASPATPGAKGGSESQTLLTVNGAGLHPGADSPTAAIEASLMNDPALTTQARITLAETFKNLYQLAKELSGSEVKP